jgi:hypothetical protein
VTPSTSAPLRLADFISLSARLSSVRESGTVWSKPIFIALVVGLTAAVSVLTPWPSVARQKGLGANGDACTVRTGVPGSEKDGECCSTSDPKDCVIILKPFPGVKALQKKP